MSPPECTWRPIWVQSACCSGTGPDIAPARSAMIGVGVWATIRRRADRPFDSFPVLDRRPVSIGATAHQPVGGLDSDQALEEPDDVEHLHSLEEWREAGHGKVPADVAHDKLVAMGYAGFWPAMRTGRS